METRLDRIEKGIEGLLLGIAELRESQKKTDEQLQRTDEQLQRTDEQLQRTDVQLEKTIAKLDRIGVQLGDLGLVQGEVAEDLFYRNVGSLFKPTEMRFSRIRRNVRKKGFKPKEFA